MKRSILALAVAAIVLLGQHCSPTGYAVGQPAPEQRRSEITITVRNDNWADAVVYVLDDQGRQLMRLGRFGALTTSSERIRRPLRGSITFAIRLFATNGVYVLDHYVLVNPGDNVNLDIHPNVRMTNTYLGR